MVSARSSNANGLSCEFQQTDDLHQLLLFSLIRSSEQSQIISAISWAVVGTIEVYECLEKTLFVLRAIIVRERESVSVGFENT